MKACGVKGTNQGLVTTYKIFTSQYIYTIYLIVSRSRNKMKVIIALTRIIQPISLYKDALDTSFVVPVAILAAINLNISW